MKILMVASEGLPFSKTGGLADVIEALPKSLVALGHEVSVLLPRYRNTRAVPVPVPTLTIPMGDGLRFPRIEEGGTRHGVDYYFVDDPEYFDREQLYGVAGKDYPDNAERFAEFCGAAIEFCKHVWMPDVIHCHDWQSGLVPVLLRTRYALDEALREVRVVFTIHNMGYHGAFPRDTMKKIGLPEGLFDIDALEFYGRVNFLKGALIFSDYLTTVSPKYAEEIQTTEYGHGLDGVVRKRADRLIGILNGVDYAVWSPERDKVIASRYSPKDMSGKLACKENLLEVFGMPRETASKPVMGIVSRFAGQKGFDLIEQVAADWMAEDLAVVALGVGEPKYEKLLRELAKAYPAKFSVKVAYDNILAHKVEAGADMFLMPSRYEPCGLNQIYSLKYGTVPVVRATGGLDDTIEAFDPATGRGTGFKFQAYDGPSLLGAIHEALSIFRNEPAAWRRIQLNGMAKDFSWQVSALEYAKLYDAVWKSGNQRALSSSNQLGAKSAKISPVVPIGKGSHGR
ncbi:MAG TPA: glycogen synthase GlgA [Candidatus Acidoferrales bacterium]|jgi:starch synthase|nr:glycogen synthase GlgA [Candidatus Acidoferrales bacterium]